MSEKWKEYYERTRKLLPHAATVQAVSALEGIRSSVGVRALDLGCGAGRDVRYLLDSGMSVTAVDADPNGLQSLEGEFHEGNLTTVCSRYDEFAFGQYDFITSQFALSFNPPETFDIVVQNMVRSLTKGGFLSVNIFGVRDGWSGNAQMTFLGEDEVRGYFDGLTIIELKETEIDGNLADGSAKHWHYFDVLATK